MKGLLLHFGREREERGERRGKREREERQKLLLINYSSALFMERRMGATSLPSPSVSLSLSSFSRVLFKQFPLN